MVCEQTCSCGHRVDKILWQTISVFDLLRSAYKWIPAILTCWKQTQAKSDFLVCFQRFHFPSSCGTQSQTFHVERRIISCATEIYRHYQDYRCILQEKNNDNWNVDGEKRIIICMDRLHKIYNIVKETTRLVYVIREETYEETLQTWIVSRRWFYRRPWEFKVKIGRGLVYFCKSHVCANKLDVQETHTSVSHSSTEAEIIWTVFPFSLSGTWLLKNFIPYRIRLDNPRKSFGGDTLQATKPNLHKPIQFKHTHVIPNEHWAHSIQYNDFWFPVLLYVFEDNEVVIKMIIKGRSPTMRHMSKIHRNALVWLFDRINLVPHIQIRYIDTKLHLADMLTEWNFTRDDWNNLFHLFNISHFSSTRCTKNFCGGRGRRRCPHSRW